jgi:hypothetical protein
MQFAFSSKEPRMADAVTPPEGFFGFRLGSDRKIARWDRIVEYFYVLNSQSENIRVINLGPSTEGNPFLMAIITSGRNLAHLEALRDMNRQLADPRGLSGARIERLIKNGKVVVCQSMSLHASEISATQMAPELAYALITGADPETKRILDNTIFLMIPCFNPDGQLMVADWYNEHAGTEYEGAALPWLYHKYCGHDNNRDAFMLNLIESRYMAKILFQDWHPQVFQDHHEMGTYGPRLFVCPYCEPVHPHADPLVWREINWYGAHMACKLEAAGKRGVITGAMFSAWSHMGFHWLGNYHNIASMLTESATARLATPVYIHPHQLQGEQDSTLHAFPHYRAQTNFPSPWPGGWWRVRDMIDQQLVAATGVLDIAARYRETVLRNAAEKALRQTAAGAQEASAGFLIRPDQHDPPTVAAMIDRLLLQGIDIRKSRTRLTLGDRVYPAGTYFIPVSQPKRGVVKTLLGRTLFPDDAWMRHKDGAPSPPYDTTTDTMAEMMGVAVEPSPVSPARMAAVKNRFAKVAGPVPAAGAVAGDGRYGFALDPRLNASYRLANALLAAGAGVARLDRPVDAGGHALPPGAFIVRQASAKDLEPLAREAGAPAYGLIRPDESPSPLKVARIGMYQRYWGGNMDEGWTRLVLEQFGFPYRTLRDAEIKAGDLHGICDALILPDDATAMIVGDKDDVEKRLRKMPVPEPYRSGIGEEGVNAVKTFVKQGGTLVAINRACGFAIEKLGLQMTDAVAGKPAREYFCPGSMLRVRVDTGHPLGYGMPESSLVMAWNSPVFQVGESHFNDRYHPVVSYPDRDILESGWLIGETHLAGRPGMVTVDYGAGRVVLYGFRVQFRAQTHGTFKLLFNALYA